jgi:hypothetical protein
MPSKLHRSRRGPYTEGQLNEIIDSLVHPLTKRSPIFWVVDGLLHGAIEHDPSITLLKFLAYDSPKLINGLEKKRRREKTKTRSKH